LLGIEGEDHGMSMVDILHEAVNRVNGARFAGIVGTDGLGVELALADGSNGVSRDEIEVELGNLAAIAAQASGRVGGGQMRDLIVEGEQMTLLASMVIPGYYAVLGVQSDSYLGRARFAVRQMVNRLQHEL
jgi:predicted regulator of Ras-like GTPase activity (Roadblock/LC7/MglB family)